MFVLLIVEIGDEISVNGSNIWRDDPNDLNNDVQNDDVGNLQDVNPDKIRSAGAIRLPPTVGNEVIHVIGTMLKLLQ